MSQFPPLKPSGRSFVPASVPVSSFASVSGKETRVILGDTATGHSLTMAFNNLLEPKARQIFDHYRGQAGTALSFTLPSDAYVGWQEYLQEVSEDQEWRYAGPPEVEWAAPYIMNVSINLVGLS